MKLNLNNACGTMIEAVTSDVDEGMVELHGLDPEQWHFDAADLVAIADFLKVVAAHHPALN